LSIITFLTTISDTITTDRTSAVGSASVGLPIGVDVETHVALFTCFLDTVTTDSRSGSAWSREFTSVESLRRTSTTGTMRRSGKLGQLEVGEWLNISEEEIIISLGTWRICEGSIVSISCHVVWSDGCPIDGGVVTSLSAVVRDTEERATVLCGVGVVHGEVTLLTICPIDDTITTVWFGTVVSAEVGGVSVSSTIVAMFERVEDTITTDWESAVGSALIWSVGVHCTVVALLTSIEESVTALVTTHWVTTITFSSVVIIALFTTISDTITTFGDNTGGSAGIGDVGIGITSIALLIKINDTITTVRNIAVGSASVGEISIVTSMIALLSWIGSSVTTELRTVGGAIDVGVVGVISQKSVCPWVDEFDRITLFTCEIIDNTITTTSEETIGTTESIWCVGVERSIITLFNSIDDTVTAVGGTGG